MIDISLNNVKKNYGFGNILDGITIDIMSNDIVCIVGENGCGKTTLLRIINGDENATSGIISKRKGASIGYLSQILKIDDKDRYVSEILFSELEEIKNVENKLKKLEKQMLNSNDFDKLIIKYTNLQDKYINMNGYEIEEKVNKIIERFKIGRLLNIKYNSLSGGEKRIVDFAKLMINNPDILLLDEPTNHLDIDMLEWLEEYLKNYKGTIIMVSHDRYFINSIVHKILLINNGKLDIYNGNYDYYVEEYIHRKELLLNKYNNQKKDIDRMKESAKKLREFGKLGDNEAFFKRAKAIEKRIDKIDKIDKPKDKCYIPLTFNEGNRSGKDVLSINNLSISYDNKVIFNNINLNIYYKDHVCLMGSNGSGKSTLIKAILNGNDNIKLGTNINIGYIPQEILFDSNKTIYDIARSYYKGEESHLRSSLFKFMFNKDNIYKKCSLLSGGEKVRLKLFCLMQDDINFLILDEPTNHIDITTKEVLENTLNEYNGTILFVSHDRYFINKIANKILYIENNNVNEYIGNYDDYKMYKHL